MKSNNPTVTAENEEKVEFEASVENLSDTADEKMFPERYVKKLREECSRYRNLHKSVQLEFDSFRETVPQALKEEHEKLTGEIAELKETLDEKIKEEEARRQEERVRKIEQMITDLAVEMDAISPKQVAVLLKDSVTIDDEGRVTAVEGKSSLKSIIENYLKNNTHLVKSKNAKKGAGASPYVNDTFAIEHLSSMTAKQYERNRDRILKSLTKS